MLLDYGLERLQVTEPKHHHTNVLNFDECVLSKWADEIFCETLLGCYAFAGLPSNPTPLCHDPILVPLDLDPRSRNWHPLNPLSYSDYDWRTIRQYTGIPDKFSLMESAL